MTDQPDAPDLTGAIAYKAVGAYDRGERWFVLSDPERTIWCLYPDGSWALAWDREKYKVPILTAAVLARGKETWEEIPLDEALAPSNNAS